MTKRVEVEFQAELKKSFEQAYPTPGNFWYKIPDLPHRNQHRKPFDIVINRGGKAYVIETKAHTKHTAWPIDDVKYHQRAALLQNGDSAYIFICVRYEDIDFVAVMTIMEYEEVKYSEKKSLTINDLEKYRHKVWYNHPAKVWDMTSIFGFITD